MAKAAPASPTMGLKVAPPEHSLANVPSPVALRERSLANAPLANVPLANISLANILSQTFPSRTFPRERPLAKVHFANIPSQTFSRLRRALALLHSSACAAYTQHDKARQTTAKLHHAVEQSYLTMSSNAR